MNYFTIHENIWVCRVWKDNKKKFHAERQHWVFQSSVLQMKTYIHSHMRWRFECDKQRKKHFPSIWICFCFISQFHVFREPWGHNDDNTVTAAAVAVAVASMWQHLAWVHNFNFAKGGEILFYSAAFEYQRICACMIQLFWLYDTRCEQQKAKHEFESKLRNQEKQTKWIVHKIKGCLPSIPLFVVNCHVVRIRRRCCM